MNKFFTLFIIDVMEKKIARMVQMNCKTVQHREFAELEYSSVQTRIVYQRFQYAMVLTTAVIEVTRQIVTLNVLNLNSNVNLLAAAYTIPGSVIMMLTVKMVVMKTWLCVVS